MAEVTLQQNNPPQTNSSGPQQQSPFRKWAALGAISLGLAIVIIDTTLLNVSLSIIIKELHTDLQSLQWVITAYALILAAFTVTGGRFGDLFGRKKMFMLGAVIFAVGSFIASISHNLPTLLLGEAIIEGFGAALMLPATSALVAANFSGKDRATAFGIWGGVAGASSAIGPLLGGYLTSRFSWRWGFRINVFVAALVLIGSVLLIKESRDERKPTIDWGGVALSSLGLLGIVFGIVESSTLGWWHIKQTLNIFHHSLRFGNISIVPVSMLLGAVILAIFFWWEGRMEAKEKTPLVSDKLLKNRQFISGAAAISLLTLSLTGIVFALPVFLQTVKNLDAFHTGLALLPISLVVLFLAPFTGVISKKIAPKYLIQAGLIATALASLVLRWETNADASVAHLIPGLVLFGLGIGLVIPPVTNLILSSVSVDEAGEASGVNNTMRQIGTSLGAAIIGAALLASLSSHLVKGIQASQVIPDAVKPQIIQTVSNPNSNVEFSSSGAAPAGTPQPVKQEISRLVAQSTTQATKDAYVYAALFAFFGFIVSLFLPTTDVHEHAPSDGAEEGEHSSGKIAVSVVLVLAAIVLSVLLLHNSSKQVPTTGAVDVQAIRNLFTPTSTPSVLGTTTYVDNSTSSVPVISTPLTRGPQTNNSVPSKNPNRAPIPASYLYVNSALGFQMQISNLWQPTESGDGHTIIFTNAQGQNVTVQVYQNPEVDLNTVAAQLQNSPSVQNLQQSNFKNEPALLFTKISNGYQGMAVIHNNTLYYIIAPSLNQPPADSFSFLN